MSRQGCVVLWMVLFLGAALLFQSRESAGEDHHVYLEPPPDSLHHYDPEEGEYPPDAVDRTLMRGAEETKRQIEDHNRNVARMGGSTRESNEMLLHLENKLSSQQAEAANAAESRGTRAVLRQLRHLEEKTAGN